MVKIRMQPGTRFCQAKPGCHCGSGSAPQQHSRAQLAPQAQARPSAATPRRRARPARLPPRQLGARDARLAHPRALRGACPGALRIGARAGPAPLAQRGHHWPPRRPPSGAAANCSRCAAQGLRPRLHAGITQNVACCPARTEPGWTKATHCCAMSLCGHRSPRGRAGPPARPRGLLGLLPLLPPGSSSARKARRCGGAAPAAPALAAEAGGADIIGPSGP